MEINLVCPVCGSYLWNETDDNDTPRFECAECGEICTAEQMDWRVFNA